MTGQLIDHLFVQALTIDRSFVCASAYNDNDLANYGIQSPNQLKQSKKIGVRNYSNTCKPVQSPERPQHRDDDNESAITRCTAPQCNPSPRSCPPAAAQTPPRTRCSSHTTRTSPGTRTRRRRCSCTPSVPRGSRPGATPSTARLTVRGWLTALATTTADSSWHNLGATPGRSCTHRHSSCFARRWTQRLRHRHRHTATARTSTIPNLTLQRAVPT